MRVMDDDQLIEHLLVKIGCIFEDTSAVLLLKHDTLVADRIAAARIAADQAAALCGAAEATARFADSGLAEK